ncbi:MAG TPA: hypothetical protein VN181_14415, partial [Thermoanaerobaculia bacterium]|nr:hypothetical protein [Thermoanaerobaculia bacterium]
MKRCAILVFSLLLASRAAHATSGPFAGKIAFVSDRDGNLEIYVASLTGTNQTRITNNTVSDSQPAWSPDGRKIAFTTNRDGNLEIYVMGADGTNETRLTSNAASDSQPTWSPDGERIVFQS